MLKLRKFAKSGHTVQHAQICARLFQVPRDGLN